MKKTILFMLSLCLVFGLSACFNFRDIEGNFEDAGYTYSETSSSIMKLLLPEFEESGIDVNIYSFNKDSQAAVIVEFSNEEDLQESLDNNKSLVSLMSGYEESDLIRENFILLPIALSDEAKQDIIDTFQE